MARVIRSPQAEQDLREIWLFIATDNEGAATRLLRSIAEKCDLLADFPGMGRLRPELGHGLHSFTVGSYVVFYQTIEGGIEIIRVLHGARDVGNQFNPERG
jgi:toxin ParE1/3/4